MGDNEGLRILAIGDPCSSLTRERVQFGLDAGYEMHWYAPAACDYWKRESGFSVDNVTCHWYPQMWIPKISALLEVVHLHRLISRMRPTLIHVFMAYPKLYNFELARRRPLVVTVMGADVLPDQGFRTWRRRTLTRVLLRHTNFITSKSEFLDGAIAACDSKASPVKRVTWGVDPDVFRPSLDVEALRSKLDLPSEGPVFFSLRSCQRFYRHEHVLEAFAACHRSFSTPATLLICRAAEELGYVSELRQLAARLDISEHIRFVGPIPPKEMPLYLNLASCAIAVPPSDGMPQSLYECLACECFPILGDLPQYQELVSDMREGYYVPLESISALATAMRWVAESPDRVKAAGREGRRRVLDVADKRKQIQIIRDLYGELIESATR